MSAVVAAEPQPLVLDLPAVSTGVRTYVENRGSVVSYLAAIARVQLGARPIVIDGQVAASYDPLEKQPELKSALQRARWNASQVEGYVGSLHDWGRGALDVLIGKIRAALEQIREALATVPSGGALTESQLRMTLEQMSYASLYTMLIGTAARQVRHGVGEFLSQLGNDHETLSRGAAALDDSLQKLRVDILNESLKYAASPITAPLGRLILKVGNETIEALEQLRSPLRDALRGHEEMRAGVSALASAVETLQAKYQAAEQAAAQGNAANRTAVLRKLKVDTALVSWQQFSEFMSKSGL